MRGDATGCRPPPSPVHSPRPPSKPPPKPNYAFQQEKEADRRPTARRHPADPDKPLRALLNKPGKPVKIARKRDEQGLGPKSFVQVDDIHPVSLRLPG